MHNTIPYGIIKGLRNWLPEVWQYLSKEQITSIAPPILKVRDGVACAGYQRSGKIVASHILPDEKVKIVCDVIAQALDFRSDCVVWYCRGFMLNPSGP
jgi:hypothetical protein